jgi:hypothetical protein
MTFLLFVCHELLGPPVKKGGNRWHCPFCDGHEMRWPSFTVLPPLGNYRITFHCHRPDCPRKFGDACDLVKRVYQCNYHEAKVKVAELMEQFRRETSPLGEDPVRRLARKLAKQQKKPTAGLSPSGEAPRKARHGRKRK